MIENMVARDGIEPPTPAFSGLRSPILVLARNCCAKCETSQVLNRGADEFVPETAASLAHLLSTNELRWERRSLIGVQEVSGSNPGAPTEELKDSRSAAPSAH